MDTADTSGAVLVNLVIMFVSLISRLLGDPFFNIATSYSWIIIKTQLNVLLLSECFHTLFTTLFAT